jgi:two-component system sensor histidine kinase FlrB
MGLSDSSEGAFDNEVCLSTAAGKRWLAIGNRKLTCASPGQPAANARPALQSIWILRDITANKQAEQEREAARNALALAEVSTILAHEIRNPLASMELFAGLIAENPEQTTQWVSNLRAGIRLLSGTVNNVLSIHCGGASHLVPINLTACLQGSVAFVQPIAEQACVSLSFAAAEQSSTILGNENALRQIILNLVCNAIRHTPVGGEITVSVQRAQRTSRAIVEVTDTGCGIPEHMLGQLFEAGFSAEGNTPGLGLAVCRRLMTQHGGEIRVSSRMNLGTTFQLEFPTL